MNHLESLSICCSSSVLYFSFFTLLQLSLCCQNTHQPKSHLSFQSHLSLRCQSSPRTHTALDPTACLVWFNAAGNVISSFYSISSTTCLRKLFQCLMTVCLPSSFFSWGQQERTTGCLRCYCSFGSIQLNGRLGLCMKVHILKQGCPDCGPRASCRHLSIFDWPVVLNNAASPQNKINQRSNLRNN